VIEVAAVEVVRKEFGNLQLGGQVDVMSSATAKTERLGGTYSDAPRL
jgi:hypothetical protein